MSGVRAAGVLTHDVEDRRAAPGRLVRCDGYLALVQGAISELSDVELSEVEPAVGTRSFQRGRGYARANRVLAIEWDSGTETLTGSVVGQRARDDTAAFLPADPHR